MHAFKVASDTLTFGIRITILVCDLIAISFLSHALYEQVNYIYTDGTGQFVDGLSLTPVSFSLLWTVISLILNFFKGPYHPGIDVGMELCSWGAVVATLWWLLMWVAYNGPYYSWGTYNCDPTDNYDCSGSGTKLLFASEVIAAAMTSIIGILHFTLFVRACRDTHLKRRLKRETVLDVDKPQELVEHIVEQVKDNGSPTYSKEMA